MNPARFLKKCLTDRAAAVASAKLVLRGIYGKAYWAVRPGRPLTYTLPTGGRLRLPPGHPFTVAFWPAVEQYEPDVTAVVRGFLRPGGTFVDCGANLGYFSVMALGLVGPAGRVVSVEANPVTSELLRQNLASNGGGPPVHAAVTARGGEVELFMSDLGDAYSSLKVGGLVTGDSVRAYKVPGRTLDDIVAAQDLSRVDLVKVDVEGAEVDVLRSADRVMRELRPAFVVEYSTKTWAPFGATAADLLRLAADRGYEVRLYDPKVGGPVGVPAETWDSGYANILLVPAGPTATPRETGR